MRSSDICRTGVAPEPIFPRVTRGETPTYALRMGKTSELDSGLVGVAGEYFVAAELSRRGFIAAITLRDSRSIDIVASKGQGGLPVSIQVKTSSGSDPVWILKEKSERHVGLRHFYAFVLLREPGELPEYYIVPDEDVASLVREGHKRWLSGRRRDGSPRKDSSMRKIKSLDQQYRDAWHSLEGQG